MTKRFQLIVDVGYVFIFSETFSLSLQCKRIS